MPELAAKFEQQTGVRVGVTYESSGNIFSQLQNGAPFDLFFSADMEYPRKLEAAGLIVPGTLSTYAVGRIVVWTPGGATLDLPRHGLSALRDSRVQKIAIANPAYAPYGRAAIAALQKAGVYPEVKKKLVFGESISQAAQFVQSGNAQVGILAESLVRSSALKNGDVWEIPLALYPPLEQAAVVLNSSRDKEKAVSFLQFVKGGDGRTVLAKHGFHPGAALPSPAGAT